MYADMIWMVSNYVVILFHLVKSRNEEPIVSIINECSLELYQTLVGTASNMSQHVYRKYFKLKNNFSL